MTVHSFIHDYSPVTGLSTVIPGRAPTRGGDSTAELSLPTLAAAPGGRTALCRLAEAVDWIPHDELCLVFVQ